MKLLVLGGTRFLGRHLVQQAQARGHEVTLFHRGRTAPELFDDAEHLRGDRNGDLSLLHGRQWDAVIDTCGYLPRVVHRSATLLRDAVDRYLFVSSISVYADGSVPGQDERSARAALPSADCEDIPAHYGALKAACEDAVLAQFGERSLLLRPGLIVGPFDPSGRFTYWVQRVARGGIVLAPSSPGYPVQFIDARDLAAWALDLLDRRDSGTFNASGPAVPLGFGAMLVECRRALGVAAEFEWLDGAFLATRGVNAWTELPLYAGEEDRGMNEVDIGKALAAGLRLRSLAETCIDTAAWASGVTLPPGIGLAPEREAALIEEWRKFH